MTRVTRILIVIDRLRRRDEAQGLAEYALILALIAIVSIVALLFLGNQISDKMSIVGSTIGSVASP
jgi:pilus assembly protein Flp/PilA